MGRFSEQTVQTYICQLAAKQSTPGGGTAAAVTASQGAALLCMVLNFTVGRKRFREHDGTLGPIQASCEAHWRETLKCADSDAAAFERVMACYNLPKTSPAEKEARKRQLERALYGAAEVPFILLRNCLSLLQAAKLVGALGNRTVLTDVIVASYLLQAAACSSETNIKINFNSVAHSQRRDQALQSLSSHMSEVEAATGAALETCQIRLQLPA